MSALLRPPSTRAGAALVLLGAALVTTGLLLPRGSGGGVLVPAAVAAGCVALVGAATSRRRRLPGARRWRRRRTVPTPEVGTRRPRAAVVYNPSKVPDLPAHRDRVERFMAGIGWDRPLWMRTIRDDPGAELYQRALREEVDVVLVAGGDGTVMAAVTALAGQRTPLAVLPVGTGNLLARNLGIPLDDEATALHIAVHGVDRAIDVGAVDGRKFAVMAGLGLDAAVVRDAPEALKRRVGWPAYAVSLGRHLRGRGIRVKVVVDDGEPMHRRVRTVVVGNVGKLQAGIPLMPEAVADDGVLDVVLIAPAGWLDWARVVARVLSRGRRPDRRVERLRGRHVLIEASSPQPRQLDGDLIEDGRTMDISVEPRSLWVRVPRRPRPVSRGRPGSGPATPPRPGTARRPATR
jgi:diacylglycerol kinase family enzyme